MKRVAMEGLTSDLPFSIASEWYRKETKCLGVALTRYAR